MMVGLNCDSAALCRTGRKRRVIALMACMLLACSLSPLSAIAEEKLPSGEECLDRFAKVTGGVAAFDKIENRVSKSTFEIPSQGIKLDMTIYSTRPNLAYALLESPALGKMERGSTGDVAWEKSLMTGPVIKEGAEKETMLRDATFESIIYWRKIAMKAECVGVEEIDGNPTYKVEMHYKKGSPRTIWFDKESGLIIKSESTIENDMGEMQLTSFVSDYREIDGILIPYKTNVKVMGQDRIITIHSVEHNVELPDGIFELPDDVKALLEK